MFENILVGVDGGDGGRDAITLAGVLAADGGRITLAHVYHGDTRFWPGVVPPDDDERDRAQELLERERARAGIEAELRWHVSPSFGRGLHELADDLEADLVVVGSSRRGLFGRVLLGDDTRAALNGAPSAVAVAPAGYSSRPVVLREIGVGYDGLPDSRHALDVARELASQHGTRLSAFEAVSLPTLAFSGPAVPDGSLIVEMVDAARERIAALDGVEPHASYGLAAEELALYSASLDLLVIGSRGYGPLGRLIYGSTTLQLLRLARSPLLVLPRADAEL